MSSETRTIYAMGYHTLGLLAFPIIGLIVALMWLWFTTGILGVGRTGFGNTAAILTMPIWAISMGLLMWLPLWLIHRWKWGAMNSARALIIGAFLGSLASLFLTGPSGFTTQGGSVLMAYAVIAICMMGGWSHNAIVQRSNP